jgi:DNA-binding protein HU-beta
MTKAELLAAMKEKLAGSDYVKAAVERVLDALGEVAGAALAGGGEVPLPGLGKLKAKKRAARTGRNPRTGEAIQINGRMGVSFEAGKALKDKLAAVTQ